MKSSKLLRLSFLSLVSISSLQAFNAGVSADGAYATTKVNIVNSTITMSADVGDIEYGDDSEFYLNRVSANVEDSTIDISTATGNVVIGDEAEGCINCIY
jgi:hypothetical protein